MTHRQQITGILNEAKARILEETGVVVNLSVVYSRDESQKASQALLKEMCAQWGVTPEWLRIPSRKEDRPIMRRLFWMSAKEKFPQVSFAALTTMVGIGNHVTAVKGIREARRWLEVKDPVFMQYYNSAANYMATESTYV